MVTPSYVRYGACRGVSWLCSRDRCFYSVALELMNVGIESQLLIAEREIMLLVSWGLAPISSGVSVALYQNPNSAVILQRSGEEHLMREQPVV